MLSSKEFIKLFSDKGYDYDLHEHQALFTVEDSNKFRAKIKGLHSKNLFLKNKKNKFYLISCDEFTDINLKKIFKYNKDDCLATWAVASWLLKQDK